LLPRLQRKYCLSLPIINAPAVSSSSISRSLAPLALDTQATVAAIRPGISARPTVLGSTAASAAPLPASSQWPRALGSGPLHTGRRACVRASLYPPDSCVPRRRPVPADAPRAAVDQRDPAAAAPPRQSRRFGSAYRLMPQSDALHVRF
jgi:hypothetical protein